MKRRSSKGAGKCKESSQPREGFPEHIKTAIAPPRDDGRRSGGLCHWIKSMNQLTVVGRLGAFHIIFACSIVGLFILLALYLGHGPKPKFTYPAVTSESLWAYIIGTFGSLLLFVILDEVCDASHWEWLGSYIENPPTTSEPDRPEKFIGRWRNSHSSAATVGAGAFVLARADDAETRGMFTSYFLGISMFLLGLASHAWWGSRRYLAWRSDHALMEAHLLALSMLFFMVSHSLELELLVVSLAVALMCLRAGCMGKARLLIAAGFSSACVVMAMRYAGGHGEVWWLVTGFSLMVLGFVPKMMDVTGQFMWGTAVFHLMESTGFAIMFLWAQSLPHKDGLQHAHEVINSTLITTSKPVHAS
eukprot:g65510.t1